MASSGGVTVDMPVLEVDVEIDGVTTTVTLAPEIVLTGAVRISRQLQDTSICYPQAHSPWTVSVSQLDFLSYISRTVRLCVETYGLGRDFLEVSSLLKNCSVFNLNIFE